MAVRRLRDTDLDRLLETARALNPVRVSAPRRHREGGVLGVGGRWFYEIDVQVDDEPSGRGAPAGRRIAGNSAGPGDGHGAGSGERTGGGGRTRGAVRDDPGSARWEAGGPAEVHPAVSGFRNLLDLVRDPAGWENSPGGSGAGAGGVVPADGGGRRSTGPADTDRWRDPGPGLVDPVETPPAGAGDRVGTPGGGVTRRAGGSPAGILGRNLGEVTGTLTTAEVARVPGADPVPELTRLRPRDRDGDRGGLVGRLFDLTDTEVEALAATGLAVELFPRGRVDTFGLLERFTTRVPWLARRSTPGAVRRSGVVVVVPGPGVPRDALRVLVDRHGPRVTVWWVGEDPDWAVPTVLDSARDVAVRRDVWGSLRHPVLVVVDPSRPGRVSEVITAARPHQVRVLRSARSGPTWESHLGDPGVGGFDLWGIADDPEPGRWLSSPVPVWTVDGLDSTPELWAALILERIRDR